VAVAPALSPPSPDKRRSARTKHSCELACIAPLEQRLWCASAPFVGLKTCVGSVGRSAQERPSRTRAGAGRTPL